MDLAALEQELGRKPSIPSDLELAHAVDTWLAKSLVEATPHER